MGYYQDMIERRKAVAERLYDIVNPRLKLVVEGGIGSMVDMDMNMRDLVALAKYTMELDLEVASLCREDNLVEEYGTESEQFSEANRLLARFALTSEKSSKSRREESSAVVCSDDMQ